MNLCVCYFCFLSCAEDNDALYWIAVKDALAANRHIFMTGHNDGFLWRAAGACCVTDACMGNAQDLTRPVHYASHGKAPLPRNPYRPVFELIAAVVWASVHL